ncbi:DUF6702 family protein [Marinoscillum sp. MHG1-6]|uniref:DUF6702 family protein n=1 Tax=Marinoscillum sp. MHG1-6 TaxID=2959627 RepID=UPI0021574C73|nr:DUF6702 family protein [Marinoscillum sp. MHG1-6]
MIRLLFAVSLMSFTSIIHPLKMTTSKIVIDQSSKEVEVVTNFFFDDFQMHLMNLYQTDISPLKKDEKEVIQDYIQNNFIISFNTDGIINLNLSSAKFIEKNVLQVHMKGQIISTRQLEKIDLTNTLLLDAFPQEQENIVHIKLKGSEHTKILHFSIQESMQSIDFK